MVKWKLYYANGVEITSETCEPQNVPGYGLLVIAHWDENGKRYLLHGKDHYWWTEYGWIGGDIFGYVQSLRNSGWQKHVLGESREEFFEIRDKAVRDVR